MNKIVDLILGILIFIGAIGFGIVKFKFPDYENKVGIIYSVILLICFCMMRIQNGNNSILQIKEKKKETKKNGEQKESKLFLLGKRIIFLLILILVIYLYLLLSILECSIFFLTITFAYFFFPDGVPLKLSQFYPCYLRITTFNFKHLLAILVISFLGYYLNQWTYAQAGEVQIAVTVALPIIYAIIYYKLKHKKEVREI